MLIDYALSQTSVIVRVKIRQNAAATSPGQGLTGLTNSSSGLIISTICDVESSATAYTVAGSTIGSITTLGTYSAPSAGQCNFKQVDSTNHPGVYEIQFLNSRFSVTNAKYILISITGASSAADCDVVIPLRSVNPYDGVHFGLTSLPNAAAAASGGLLTYGTGTGQINPTSGGVDLQTIKTQTVTCSAGVTVGPYVGNAIAALQVDSSGYVKVSAGTGTGQISITSGVVSANATQFAGQTITCSAGVTVSPYVGNATAALSVDSSGYAKISPGTGLGQIQLSTGRVTVYSNADKTGYSLTQAFPTNFSSLSIDASGRVNVGSWLGNAVTVDANNYPNVNVYDYNGSAVSAQPYTGTPPTASAIATAVLTDTTDLATSGSIGYVIGHQLGGAFTTSSSSVLTTASLANAPTGGSAPSAATIATAVWQDSTSGDFTTSGSIGKLLYNQQFDTSGYAKVSTGTGTGQIALSSGAVTAGTVSDKTGYALASNGVDAITAETGFNLRQSVALILNAVLAKLSGATGSTITIRDVNDTANRAVVNVDGSGNRTSTTLTPPA